MEDPHQFFSVPKHMNKGRRWLGFPVDEIAPALTVFGLSFWLHHEMIGLALSLAWFGGLRYIKSQHGDNIIALAIYWWGASFINSTLFKRTPSATRRYWIF
ncbi:MULTISPECIES: type IV conjugative transfer system protein TraL [Vibrio harveyi group]|uniref:type IV conjugative transfer system protein TraL n=1 Tax=Vibrio harveyi group TaxID=717610 RepID=UPI0003DC696E|nr:MULTISPECIES: type IV conjugative transfer system protein TraL [Vibrio harveyi group]APP09080.1 type IV conjugative transfer system protein TraL [Vibrio harveyi]EJV8818784.1 type IV conjugative transfer system protein TraL [Vibrio parahaemolyticus]ETJ85986.1 type IV conjugative transfer system protein TraL [Vibrio parahaemolyticus 970107]